MVWRLEGVNWPVALRRRPPFRILFLGLHGSGKTSCVRRLRGENIADVIPTVAFNVDDVTHRGVRLTIWDVGGADPKIRPLCRHYFPNTQGLVLVVDSADLERVGRHERDAGDGLQLHGTAL